MKITIQGISQEPIKEKALDKKTAQDLINGQVEQLIPSQGNCIITTNIPIEQDISGVYRNKERQV